MRQYFATLRKEELTPELGEKVKRFNDYVEKTGLRRLWCRSHDFHFGKHMGESGVRSSSVKKSGADGELAAYSVNVYRNNIKHVMALTTASKPSYDPRAKNTDSRSMQQTRLASNIIDDYMSEKRMGRHMALAAERSLVYSKGFVYMTWDPSLGKAVDAQPVIDESGQPKMAEDGKPVEKVIYEGDVSVRAKSPFDVIYDSSLRDWSQCKWVIVREYENKWDLAARHPEMAEEIIGATSDDALDHYNFSSQQKGWVDDGDDSDDLIPVYHFYHLKTDAMPNGRYTKFLNEDLCLYDDAIPYKKRLPVFRITPGEVFDSAEGYTDAFDMLQLQEVVNVLSSIPFTNQQAFGTQLVWLPDGCNLSASQIKGLAFLKGGPPGSEPRAVQLTQSPKEIFESKSIATSDMEQTMGLNAAIRGDADASLKGASGVTIGRYQAMAIQFSSNFQRSWAELLEDCGTFLFELLRDFAKSERLAAKAGKHNKGAMVSFTGDDLEGIDRVSVDLGNPLSRTAAGRLELANTLLEKGEINGRQYIEVTRTGNLEAEVEGQQSELELVRKENEQLMDGQPVRALVGDKHTHHAQEHRTVINDPHLRTLAASGDEGAMAILDAVLAHIQEHMQLAQTQDPFWSMVAGEPPAPQPMMPPPPGPNGPPPMGPPPGPPQGPDGGLPMPPPPPPAPDGAMQAV